MWANKFNLPATRVYIHLQVRLGVCEGFGVGVPCRRMRARMLG